MGKGQSHPPHPAPAPPGGGWGLASLSPGAPGKGVGGRKPLPPLFFFPYISASFGAVIWEFNFIYLFIYF